MASLTRTNGEPGVYPLAVGKEERISNHVPFAVDTLPECLEQEPNNAIATAHRVTLPIIVNGRIDQPGDWDVFRFEGRPGIRSLRRSMPAGWTLRWIPCSN